jgi:hypothetical protein
MAFKMKTKKQEELVNTYLSQLDDGVRPLYHELAVYLSELGYNPKKEKSSISYKHDFHNKQMAKMGMNINKKKGASPFFALRFSACRGYSARYADIVGAYIAKYATRAASCVNGGCTYCKGKPESHVYTHTFPDGESKFHCGAYALEIPDIAPDDISELKKLIKEEHEYLMKHEAQSCGL